MTGYLECEKLHFLLTQVSNVGPTSKFGLEGRLQIEGGLCIHLRESSRESTNSLPRAFGDAAIDHLRCRHGREGPIAASEVGWQSCVGGPSSSKRQVFSEVVRHDAHLPIALHNLDGFVSLRKWLAGE